MRNLILNPPLLGFVVGTRVALAFGVGLLMANRLEDRQRRSLALSLIGFGAATTVPAMKMILSRRAPTSRRERLSAWARSAVNNRLRR